MIIRNVLFQVTLPDGKVVDAESWTTTPFDVANGISAGLAQNSVISKVRSIASFWVQIDVKAKLFSRNSNPRFFARVL